MLQVVNYPEYISPSSYMSARKCKYTFALNRLLKLKEKDPQMISAAYGSAFDFYVKNILCEIFPDKKPLVESLKDKAIEIHDEDERRKIFAVGRELYSFYQSTPIIKDTDWADIEVNRLFKFKDVPIYAKGDAVVKHKGKICPLDWKVRGINSSASPTPGYIKCYSEGKILPKPPHKKWNEDIAMHEIDVEWAIQLTFYNWMLNSSLDDNYAIIHEVTKTPSGAKQLAVIEARLTKKFQEFIYKDVLDLWKSLQDGRFIESLVTFKNLDSLFILASNESWMNSIEHFIDLSSFH